MVVMQMCCNNQIFHMLHASSQYVLYEVKLCDARRPVLGTKGCVIVANVRGSRDSRGLGKCAGIF